MPVITSYPAATSIDASDSLVALKDGALSLLTSSNVLHVYEGATLAAAQSAAVSGDTIEVHPGAYALTSGLGKSGVNWHFHAGAVVTATDCYCFDVSTGITFAVTGAGQFLGTRTSGGCGGLRVNHESAVVSFQCQKLRNVDGSASAEAALWVQAATRVYVEAEEISGGSTAYYVIYWESGDLFCNARRIFNEGGATSAATIFSQSTGAGYKMWINADEVFHANSSAFGAVQVGGSSDATSAIWMTVKELRCSASSLYACVAVLGGKFYLNAQKIFNSRTGGVGVRTLTGSPLTYITTQKIEASAALVLGGTGTSWIHCDEFNDSGFSGTTIATSAGTHYISGKSIARTGSGVGVSHSGGTARVDGLYIVPIDGASNYPVSVSGSGLTIKDCVLVAPATPSYCVNAGSSQTVVAAGAIGNKTTNNITFAPTSGYAFDSAVA